MAIEDHDDPTPDPEATPVEIPFLEPEELHELATGILTGQVFSDRTVMASVPEDRVVQTLGMIWMPLGLGVLQGRDPSNIGLIYSWLRDAGPRSVNGFPIFYSMNLVHKDQLQLLQDKLNELGPILRPQDFNADGTRKNKEAN